MKVENEERIVFVHNDLELLRWIAGLMCLPVNPDVLFTSGSAEWIAMCLA